ncbi:hypothetical protein VNI00_006859 [Paramarasmius palmivorus]|uniref:Uncharacterized protein n=1 Tax=Paramarasmius palmivorus TaxID=297713 RepID=A0AAW0D4S3_9AGAR
MERVTVDMALASPLHRASSMQSWYTLLDDTYTTDNGPFYCFDTSGNLMESAHYPPWSDRVDSLEASVIPYENTNQGPMLEYSDVFAPTTLPVVPSGGDLQLNPADPGVELPSVKKPIVASDRVRAANENRRRLGKKLYHCTDFSPCTATFTARHNLKSEPFVYLT